MEEWKEYRLGEVLTIKYGKDHKKLLDGDIPVYGSGGIMRYVNNHIYEGPSIMIPRKGSLNNIMYSDKPFWTVDTMFWSIIKTDIVNPLFLYYTIYKKDFASLNVGTAVPSLTVPVIEDILVTIPPLPTQQKIDNILSSLDDKIEVNRRINENLEAQAQALFKSWFVDFEPFKDGEFVESELGMIPKGWRVKRLEEVSKLIAGGDKPDVVSLNKTDDTPYAIYSNGIDNYGLYGFSDNYRIKEESVTVSARGTIGYVCLREEPYTPIVRLISVIPDTNFISAKYMYHSLKIKPIQGTGTTQQQLTVPMFRNTLLVIPSQELMDSFTIKVNSMFELRRNNQQEISRLASLRDTLLPKLMSGEVDVNDVKI